MTVTTYNFKHRSTVWDNRQPWVHHITVAVHGSRHITHAFVSYSAWWCIEAQDAAGALLATPHFTMLLRLPLAAAR